MELKESVLDIIHHIQKEVYKTYGDVMALVHTVRVVKSETIIDYGEGERLEKVLLEVKVLTDRIKTGTLLVTTRVLIRENLLSPDLYMQTYIESMNTLTHYGRSMFIYNKTKYVGVLGDIKEMPTPSTNGITFSARAFYYRLITARNKVLDRENILPILNDLRVQTNMSYFKKRLGYKDKRVKGEVEIGRDLYPILSLREKEASYFFGLVTVTYRPYSMEDDKKEIVVPYAGIDKDITDIPLKYHWAWVIHDYILNK